MTWSQYVASVHPWERQTINDVTTDLTSLIYNILNMDQHWLLVSDGSYSEDSGILMDTL